MKNVRRSVALVGFVLLAGLSLAGCSGATSGGGTTGGGTSGQVDSGESGSGQTTTTPPGDVNMDELASLPATFPTDIPLIDGDVKFGLDLGTGWSVVIAAEDFTAGYADASAKLTSAGLEAQVDNSTADGSFGVFTSDKYQINVTAGPTADYGNAVSYVVVLVG